MSVESLGDPVDLTGPFSNNTIGAASIVSLATHELPGGLVVFTWTEASDRLAYFSVFDAEGSEVIAPQRASSDALVANGVPAGYQETVYGAAVDEASGNITLYSYIFYPGDPFAGVPPVFSHYTRAFSNDGTALDADAVPNDIPGSPFLGGAVGSVQLSDGSVAFADSRGLVIADGGTVVAQNVSAPGIETPRAQAVTETADGILVLSGIGNTLNPASSPLTAQLYDPANGDTIGDAITISSGSGDTFVAGSGLDIATLSSGQVIATWNEARDDDLADASGTGIYFRMLGPDGTPTGPVTLVNTSFGSGDQYGPRVFSLANGGFAIVYNTINSDAPLDDTTHNTGVIQTYDETGAPQGDPYFVEPFSPASLSEIFPDGTGLIIGFGGTGRPITIEGSAEPEPPIFGTPQPDDLQGTPGADRISARESDDTVTALAGDDTVLGGAGNDQIFAGPGADSLLGGDDDDSIFGAGDDDIIFGGAGNDLVGGGTGDDSIDGGIGNDSLFGAAGNDTLIGGAGDDLLGGSVGNDSFEGGSGSDTIWTADGDDVAHGGTGADTLGGSLGHDTLTGGDGADEMWGAIGDDSLSGGAGNDTLGGFLGNDDLDGGDGNDELWGAAGNDTLQGGLGDDQIGGGIGDDEIYELGGNNTISGGLGNDSLRGANDQDTIYGASGNDTISGLGDIDLIYTGIGDDLVFAGDGDDIVYAAAGENTVNGADGDDTIYLNGMNGDTVSTSSAGFGNDTIHGFQLIDTPGGGAADTLDIFLWTGIDGLTAEQVVDTYGDIVDGNAVLDFGVWFDREASITLIGVSGLEGLADTIIV